ncbi:MAG: hypothetical protein IPQ18_04065 [Saprospiraceae bacterium]|nr:hypothetical protein [Saprospiraceae bacterium]
MGASSLHSDPTVRGFRLASSFVETHVASPNGSSTRPLPSVARQKEAAASAPCSRLGGGNIVFWGGWIVHDGTHAASVIFSLC